MTRGVHVAAVGRLQHTAVKSNASDRSAAMKTVVKWDAITHRTLICHPCSARSVVSAGDTDSATRDRLSHSGWEDHTSLVSEDTKAASTRIILPLGSFGRRPVSSYRACGSASRVGRIARYRVWTLLSWSPVTPSAVAHRAQGFVLSMGRTPTLRLRAGGAGAG